jgi:hypothetical protein
LSRHRNRFHGWTDAYARVETVEPETARLLGLPARDIDLRDLRLFFAISFAGLHIGKWPALPTVSSRYSDLIAAIGSIATARPARR